MHNYKRILLKLSGEAFKDKENILSEKVLDDILQQVKTLVNDYKIQVAIVIGGGNIWRGINVCKINIDPEKADYMGMMATSINALGITSYFNENGVKALMQNALDFEKISSVLDSKKAISALNKNTVVVFGGGTGKPFLSTDTAAAMRALEIKADAIFMAKNGVDGVYTSDPKVDKDAKHIPCLTYNEIISKQLKVADIEAMKKLKGKGIDIILFNMNSKNNIVNLFKNPKTKRTIITN